MLYINSHPQTLPSLSSLFTPSTTPNLSLSLSLSLSPVNATMRSILLLLLLLSPPTLSQLQPECERSSSFIPTPAFTNIIQSTLSEIRQIVSTISSFSGIFSHDRRLSSAVADCLEVLDLSADELSLSLNPVSGLSTGHRLSDLKTWLSAALGNQDTCRESLSGTSSILASLVGHGLESVTSLISQSLIQVGPTGGQRNKTATLHANAGTSNFAKVRRQHGRKLLSRNIGDFPKWVKAEDRRRILQGAEGVAVDVVVAADGSGNVTTVSEAVEKVPEKSEKRFVIYVKKGVYNENVEIKKKKWNVMLIGDGVDQTVISGSRNYVDGWTTFRSATFAVSGKGLIARDLTIENIAGPNKHQAVALRSDSDLSVYYRCAFRGYQDTLYAHSLRQFYRECIITGTVDFIFGNAAAVFQSSLILARLPLPNQKNTVTAHGRKDPYQNTGFSLQFCNITADSELASSVNQSYTYLGRPWKEYSRTIVMQSYLGNAIRPEGWLEWQGDFALNTLYYAEFMNYGPGSGLASRVKWPGFHALNSSNQATNFTVAQFIDGNLWLPSTGVKYTAGLTV